MLFVRVRLFVNSLAATGLVAVPGVSSQLSSAPPTWAPLPRPDAGRRPPRARGRQLGAQDPLDCAFLAWWSRGTDALACDGSNT
jgi:hypothetical protein